MLYSLGEDPPSKDDIDYFGLLYSCQNTYGDFALYESDECYAARGRLGTSPLYWNPKTKSDFSFFQSEGLVDFPPGHLYDGKRLVCWDHMYYDKPIKTQYDAAKRIDRLLRVIIRELESKVDAFLFYPTTSSMLVMRYIERDDVHAYTAIEEGDGEVVNEIDHTMVPGGFYELARYIKENTPHRKLLCGVGFSELFSDGKSEKYVHLSHLVKEFSKFGLEVYSPFCDVRLVDYIMDMTLPEDRKNLLQVTEEDGDVI